MAKPLKIALLVAAGLLVLLVGGVFAAAMLFDPDDYRGQIAEAVKKKTGRELELGHLDLKIFPWLAVAAENVKLGNAEGFGPEPFAEVQKAQVGVKLLPLLLDRRVKVGTLSVNGLKLQLALDEEGNNNWSDLAEKKDEKEPEPESAQPIKLEDLDIEGLEIDDSAVSYSDAQTGKSYRLENFRLKSGGLQSGEPVTVDMGASVAASAPSVTADLALSGTLAWDLEQQRYGMDPLLLNVKGQGKQLMQGRDGDFAIELRGKLDAEPGKQLSIGSAVMSFDAGHAQLRAKGEYGGDLTYDLAAQQLAIPALTLSVQAAGDAIPGRTQDVKLAGALNYDKAQGSLRLDGAKLEALGLAIAATISGSGLGSETPKLSGPIRIAPFSPRELLAKLGRPPIVTADPGVLKEASLDAHYRGDFKSAALSDVTLKLDQSTARGRIDIRSFETQAIQFALNVDTLDADRYLAPKSTPTKNSAAGKPDNKSINQIELPSAALDALNAEGTLDVGLLKVKNLKINNARVRLAGGRGEVKKQEITAKLYGGTVALTHQYTPGARPRYAAKTQLSALNANPFLQDFIGKDWVSGLGSIHLDLSGAGLTVGDLRGALNGDLGIKIESGAVKGFNLGQIIRKGQAALKGQVLPASSEPEKTDFSALSFSARVVNGILKSDSLNAASPLFRLAGAGEINLVNETINYLAKPTIVESSRGEGGKGLEELKGLMIPIRLTGNLFAPTYKIDWETALKQQALSRVNEKIEEKKDELKARRDEEKDRLKQKLNDKLNKLFAPKQPKAEPAPAPAPAPAPTEPAATAPPG